MIVCKHCHYTENPESALACEHCGRALAESGPLRRTRALYVTTVSAHLVIRDKHIGKLGTHEIALYVAEFPDPLIASVTQETVLGRVSRVASITAQPSVDLTAFQAMERGVSRAHAALRRCDDTLTLLDLDSTNGTWLNETRLPPHVPTPINNGDRIMLAKMPLFVFYA